MCGRYALTLPPEAARSYFGYVEQPNFPPRYNIAPTQPIAIMRYEFDRDQGAHRHFALARWGLWPSWLKDPREFPLIINARDDSLNVKASFRGAIRHRRCIVLADGFYEWMKPANRKERKRPFLIRRPSRQPLAFAGLWENWLGADGSEVETACIVTTSANGLMSALHERMPAILEPAAFATWLDHRSFTPDEAMKVIRPAPNEALELVEVGPAVGSVANEGPQLQEPAKPAEAAQTSASRKPNGNLDFDF